jgi:hypothetical protein
MSKEIQRSDGGSNSALTRQVFALQDTISRINAMEDYWLYWENYETLDELKKLVFQIENSLKSNPGEFSPTDILFLSSVNDVRYVDPDGYPTQSVEKIHSLHGLRERAQSCRDTV